MKVLGRKSARSSWGLILLAGATLSATAQTGSAGPPLPAPQQQPAASPSVPRRVETPVEGLTRRDGDRIALALSGAQASVGSPISELQLQGFEFDGNPVDTSKLHFKRLSPTAIEITSVAYSLGEWRFFIRDHASYFGLGEHFDTLDRTHTIVKNASQDNGGPKGSSTYKPIPFFMSTSGYGLWVDTTAEATFDMNASALTEIAISVPAERLRLVLFTSPEFPKILEQFTALTQRAILPPYWAFAPWMGRDYHQNEAQVQEDVEKTRSFHLPASVIVIDSPWATSYNSYKLNPKQFQMPLRWLGGSTPQATSWCSGTRPGSTPDPIRLRSPASRTS